MKSIIHYITKPRFSILIMLAWIVAALAAVHGDTLTVIISIIAGPVLSTFLETTDHE